MCACPYHLDMLNCFWIQDKPFDNFSIHLQKVQLKKKKKQRKKKKGTANYPYDLLISI